MSEWQPIETCPKDGTLFDVWEGNQRIADCCFCYPVPDWSTAFGAKKCVCMYSYGFDGETNWIKLSGATHWMPIPDAPKGE